MSTSIVKFEEFPEKLVYCKSASYPTGLGFDLLKLEHQPLEEFMHFFESDSVRFEEVQKIPQDIQYEYTVLKDGAIQAQESWFAADASYHGGGFRHGRSYDLHKVKESIKRQEEYSYRLPKWWE